MNKMFDFEELENHDLYHLRYGKGAVIVAFPSEDEELKKASWDSIQNELFDEAAVYRRKLKAELSGLNMKLKDVSGGVRRFGQKPIDEETIIRKKINTLDDKIKLSGYRKKPYFTNIQLASFYSHNNASTSHIKTRFDRIVSIEELGTHVKILLEFSSEIKLRNLFYSNIISSEISRGEHTAYPVVGVVQRVIPINNITLEIITHQVLL